VLEALGLDPKEYIQRIYDGLTEMVKERLELPKMRKKQKTQGKKIAYDEIKKAVVEDIIPNGTKKFPIDFYTAGDYEHLKFEIYPSNGKKLKADSFFSKFEVKDEDDKLILETDSDIKAEFAIILSGKENYQIKIPKDEKIAQIIINAYKIYIKNLKQDLEKNAYEKLHEWSSAERMAKEIMEEWG
jgi:hypothetical protein